MLIVDSQIHIWDADTPQRPWVPGLAAQQPHPVTKDMLLAEMATAGVDRVVLVPPSWEGDRNDLALAAAAAHPDRFAVMGRFSPDRAQNRQLVPGWRTQPGMLGMRLTFHNEPQRSWLTDGTVDWLWPAAEAAGIPIMVYSPGRPALFAAIAERHPGLKLIIDHAGLDVHTRGAAAFEPLSATCDLARFPNVAVKASGLACHSTEGYPFRDVHAPIRQLVDAFGPRRAFWGTDLTRMQCSYRQCVTLFTEELPWLRGEALAQVMGLAICDWLDWPVERSA